MLHGCRSDLILNCLVKSNKDRNLYLYLVSLNKSNKTFERSEVMVSAIGRARTSCTTI